MSENTKKISRAEVEHVTKLANLPLTEAEIERFSEQLSQVIDYNINELKKVSTDGVEPITNITGLKDIFRSDEAEPGLTQKEALANAQRPHNGFFKVKAILE